MYNVNASLIREVRMIAQQFFRSRDNVAFWESWSPKPRVAVLKCGFCIRNMDGKQRDAVAVIEGYSVCTHHLRSIT